MKIHLALNIALLEQYRRTDPKKQIVEIEANDVVWKMESIIASGPSDKDIQMYVYLVKWERTFA